MDQEELFRRLAASLAIGLLIGLERGWQLRDEAEGGRTAGLRTHAITGLLGGICAAMSVVTNPAILAVALASFTATFALFAWSEATSERNFSVTGAVAAILTFVLGAYAVLGDQLVAVAAAVAAAIILALKQPLHSWVRELTWPEVRAALTLLAMSFLLLPVLPNRALDPWGALNPAEIWLMAIVIAGVSFVGYVATRVIGDQTGVALAAIAGGVTSSTATTLAFARLARDQPHSSSLLAGGILIAGLTLVVRVVIIASALKPALLSEIIMPATAAATVLIATSSLLILRQHAEGAAAPALRLQNPFDVTSALKLAGLIAIVMLLTRMISERVGARGVLLLAAGH